MKLRTIGFIRTLVLGLLAASLPAEAQQTTKVPRVGFLTAKQLGITISPEVLYQATKVIK